MKGSYIPHGDGFGIVGFHYDCPECGHITKFVDCEIGCEDCGFSEPYTDPDNWYEEEMKKDVANRSWNNSNDKR